MLGSLISSRTRIRLLSLFLLNPGREYYIREIERITGENINAVRRELANLAEFGIIRGERKGNQQYYTVNPDHFLYTDLQRIFLKTEGAPGMIRDALSGEPVTCMFVYGSFAKGTSGEKSDIDLFLIGDISEDRLIPVVHDCEERLGREINYTLMTEEEFSRRKVSGDPFVTNIMREEKIFLIGTCDD